MRADAAAKLAAADELLSPFVLSRSGCSREGAKRTPVPSSATTAANTTTAAANQLHLRIVTELRKRGRKLHFILNPTPKMCERASADGRVNPHCRFLDHSLPLAYMTTHSFVFILVT